MISAIGKASYHLAKYLAHVLSLLNQSEFNVKSKKFFMDKVRQVELHKSYQMILLDVKSLFSASKMFTLHLTT